MRPVAAKRRSGAIFKKGIMTLANCTPGDGIRINGEVHQVLSILKDKVQVVGMQRYSAKKLLPATTKIEFICSEREAAKRYFAELHPQNAPAR